LHASGADTRIELEHVTMRAPAGVPGLAIAAGDGAHAELRHVEVSGWAGFAVYVADGSALLEDIVLRDVTSGGPGALAIGAVRTGTLEVRRARLENIDGIGVLAQGAGRVITLEDVTLRAVRGGLERSGYGIAISAGAEADLARIAITESAEGIGVFEASARLSDVRVVDAVALGPIWSGTGLTVLTGDVEAERLLVERAQAMGVHAGEGATVRLTDLTVRATRARPCEDDCELGTFGAGVVAQGSGRVAIERFFVGDNELCGVRVVEGGFLELHQGEVSGNPIGASVEVPEFDVAQLYDRVVFDNVRNLDRSGLPVARPDLISPDLP
nr:hypothetical protein [Myxococcota bacterium]